MRLPDIFSLGTIGLFVFLSGLRRLFRPHQRWLVQLAVELSFSSLLFSLSCSAVVTTTLWLEISKADLFALCLVNSRNSWRQACFWGGGSTLHFVGNSRICGKASYKEHVKNRSVIGAVLLLSLGAWCPLSTAQSTETLTLWAGVWTQWDAALKHRHQSPWLCLSQSPWDSKPCSVLKYFFAKSLWKSLEKTNSPLFIYFKITLGWWHSHLFWLA